MTSTHLGLNEIPKVNIQAKDFGWRTDELSSSGVFSCCLSLGSQEIRLSCIVEPSQRKGWVFVIKRSFIHQVGSLLRQQPAFKRGATRFLNSISCNGCRPSQQE